MIKKLIAAIATVTFITSCATSPEPTAASGSDAQQNIDSDISFDGVSDPNEDPFFSDESTVPSGSVTESTPPPVDEAQTPTPTPEPSAPPRVAIPEPVKEESEMPQASWEMEEAETTPAVEPTPTPAKVKTAAKPKANKTAQKQPASALSGDAMRAPASDCSLRAEPGKKAAKIGKVSKGRKVWTENHNSEWFKVYREQGHAFISKTCF